MSTSHASSQTIYATTVQAYLNSLLNAVRLFIRCHTTQWQRSYHKGTFTSNVTRRKHANSFTYLSSDDLPISARSGWLKTFSTSPPVQ